MAQIDGEVRQQSLDIPPLLIPTLHALHRETMPQGPQARSATTGGGPQPDGVTQREKPASQGAIRERPTLLGNKEEVR